MLQPEPSFFLDEVQRKQFAYERENFYEQLKGEFAFTEKPENPCSFPEELTDKKMNKALDSAFFLTLTYALCNNTKIPSVSPRVHISFYPSHFFL